MNSLKRACSKGNVCKLFFLELKQYKNDSIWSNDKLALNLPRFFTLRYGVWKRAANSKLICFSTKWCRSYIVFALQFHVKHTKKQEIRYKKSDKPLKLSPSFYISFFPTKKKLSVLYVIFKIFCHVLPLKNLRS